MRNGSGSSGSAAVTAALSKQLKVYHFLLAVLAFCPHSGCFRISLRQQGKTIAETPLLSGLSGRCCRSASPKRGAAVFKQAQVTTEELAAACPAPRRRAPGRSSAADPDRSRAAARAGARAAGSALIGTFACRRGNKNTRKDSPRNPSYADFLLQNDAARELYHGYAARVRVIDCHCHLPPAEVAGEPALENMTRVWLGGDHYKWRALRSNGIDEAFITGDAPTARSSRSLRRPCATRCSTGRGSSSTRYFDCYDLLTPAGEDLAGDPAEGSPGPTSAARGLMTRGNV